MPSPATIADLLALIHKSGLFEADRLDACVGWAMREEKVETPTDLAAALVRAGLLTQFHAEQFLLGKHRGFSIGKYTVLERLGFGGMGIVYLCEHQVMGQRVAVKVLPVSKNENPAALGRFYREARAAGALAHPNLVRAHDIGQDGNLHYLVLDFVDGASLHQMVMRSGPLAAPRAAHYIGQAARGLEHARLAGLVHRDIKPANILVDRSGVTRVLDLGLARFYEDETDALTLKYDEKNVLGTADYVAPEQALNSHDVDTRADVYSLGCTFYFVLAGRPPFPDGKTPQKLIWHQMKEPEPIQLVRPDVPNEMAAVLARMMAKAPAARFQTPGEVVAALEPWLAEPAPLPSERELPLLCIAAMRHAGSDSNHGLATPSRGSSGTFDVARPMPTPAALDSRPAPVALKRLARPRTMPAIAQPTPHGLSLPIGADTVRNMLSDQPPALSPPSRPPAPPRVAAPPRPPALARRPAPVAEQAPQARTTAFIVGVTDEPAALPKAAPRRAGIAVWMQLLRLAVLLMLGILATVGARWGAARVPKRLWTMSSHETLTAQTGIESSRHRFAAGPFARQFTAANYAKIPVTASPCTSSRG